MNLDFARRMRIGYSIAVNVLQLAPCETAPGSRDIDERYADVSKSEDFPNPWHIGTLDSSSYPNPHQLIQSELELLAFMYTFVLQLKPKLVVETGCNVGLMTRALAAGCWTNGFGRVVSCDTNPDMVKYATKVCAGLPAEIRECSSLDLMELWEADLAYIDSSNEDRTLEIQRIKSGAAYVYHDTYAERATMYPQMDLETFVTHFDSPRGFSIVRVP